MDKFKLENLGSGITAVISKEHGFGTDALLLADFAAVKESNRCCDMGSGCGIIPLLWLKKNMSRPVAAIEISEQGCEQMKRAAEVNSLGGRLEVYNKDLRNVREFLPAGEFDVVTMNPPYKAEGAGIVSADGGGGDGAPRTVLLARRYVHSRRVAFKIRRQALRVSAPGATLRADVQNERRGN